LNLPQSAKGLGTIKGAEQREISYKRKSKTRFFDTLIIIIIVLIALVIGYLVARQTGMLPEALNIFKSEPEQISTQVATTDISNIVVSDITSTGASVSWSTSTVTYGSVLYGKTESYGMTATSDGEQSSHKAILSGLEPGNSYHYVVIANDNNNTEIARSADQLFSTPAAAVASPTIKAPVVKGYQLTPTDTGAFIRWTTDEPSTSQILYGTDAQCSNSTPIDSTMVTEHSIRVTGLNVNSVYFYRIKSVNASGGVALMDPPDTFTTLITVPTGYKIGERAPDFTLPIFQSQETISLRSFKGQKVLLTFWAVYCPECDRELSLLQSLKNKNLTDVNIICIFLESKLDDIEKTIAKYKEERGDLTVPVIVDMYKTAAHLYNIEKLPCTFFIDGDGIIRDVEYGNFNINQVEEKLKDL
jgi:peroxiredoxin